MAEEEVHPIELDDGNIAPEVERVLRPALQQEVTPEDVYNRIVHLDTILHGAIDDFKVTMRNNFADTYLRTNLISGCLQRIKRYARREVDFAVGDTVVLLDERKIGEVKNVTERFVDVQLDRAPNVHESVLVRKRRSRSFISRLYGYEK